MKRKCLACDSSVVSRHARPLLGCLLVLLAAPYAIESWQSQSPPSRWTTGFWFWHGSSTDITWSAGTLDVLYVHVGNLWQPPGGGKWQAFGELPEELPAAREYWLVFRFDRQSVPGTPAAAAIAERVNALRAAASRRHLKVAGVQLDIDSPTASLGAYAAFLRELRGSLPPDLGISITALLDWFRPGTAIDEVVHAVDEFVPQFYDIGQGAELPARNPIAARIDTARWSPEFNRFGKRFRIGISSFGRAASAAKHVYFRDLKPLDLAVNPAFQLEASRSPAGELVLTYRAARKAEFDYNSFAPGDSVQFTLATPESVRSAVESARAMGGYVAGVVFFRWPESEESLAMQPDEVLGATPSSPTLLVSDGHCAAVRCVDLYLRAASPFSPTATHYRIHSSVELDYFLPEAKMPVRMAGASDLELSLPPYCARGLLFLGRAVTARPAGFGVEERP